jgi:bifunctional DNase/RNase
MVECELVRIIIDEHHDEQVIFLREKDGPRVFPILIGIFEATVIDRILKERTAERPLTHDLLCEAIERLGARVRAVSIDDVQEDVFFAKLRLERGLESIAIDARPSDAIAIALHERAPIIVAEKVLAMAGKHE